jgi:hypothetical protein
VTAATLTLLGAFNIPAGVLAAGDRLEIQADYAQQSTADGFSIQVDWGATALVHRDAAASESLVSGQGSAAILASGAPLSAESRGTVLALAAGAASASDNYSAGIAVSFIGSLACLALANSGDSVTCTSFSVRVP